MAKSASVGDELAELGSLIYNSIPSTEPIDLIIEILVIYLAPRYDVELLGLHNICYPFDENSGWDYNKVFVDDVSYHEGHGEAYKNYGVSKEQGCVVMVRLDQYVDWIGELEDLCDIDRYFSEILISQ